MLSTDCTHAHSLLIAAIYKHRQAIRNVRSTVKIWYLTPHTPYPLLYSSSAPLLAKMQLSALSLLLLPLLTIAISPPVQGVNSTRVERVRRKACKPKSPQVPFAPADLPALTTSSTLPKAAVSGRYGKPCTGKGERPAGVPQAEGKAEIKQDGQLGGDAQQGNARLTVVTTTVVMRRPADSAETKKPNPAPQQTKTTPAAEKAKPTKPAVAAAPVQPAPQGNGADGSGMSQGDWITAHNNARAKYGAGMVTWSEGALAQAQANVDAHRNNCHLDHTVDGKYGENLMGGSGGNGVTKANDVVRAFMNEAKDFNYNDPNGNHGQSSLSSQ